jgi:hypothetical protein
VYHEIELFIDDTNPVAEVADVNDVPDEIVSEHLRLDNSVVEGMSLDEMTQDVMKEFFFT